MRHGTRRAGTRLRSSRVCKKKGGVYCVLPLVQGHVDTERSYETPSAAMKGSRMRAPVRPVSRRGKRRGKSASDKGRDADRKGRREEARGGERKGKGRKEERQGAAKGK